MASGSRYYTPTAFEIDGAGVPLAGGKLWFYASGTSTPLATYSDKALTTPNANPVVANASGHWGSIFLSMANYRVVCTDADDVEQWAYDDVGPGAVQATAGMVGEIKPFAGPASNVPAGWYLCYGQTLSRTTDATLYAVIGTYWGAGDGLTTFALPDLRGRTLFGIDNMGGVAANRITAGISGVPGLTLGGVGGDQRSQGHTHSVTDPQHTHTLTDPTHTHDIVGSLWNGSGGTPSTPTGTTAGAVPVMNNPKTAAASTGITMANAATGISLQTYGAGNAQNMPPCGMVNWIIYAGA